MSETSAETATERVTTRGLTWMGGIVAVIGLWIAASSFVFTGMSQASFWNNVVIGVAIFLIAGYNTYRLMNDETVSMAGSALVTLLGLWMIAAPFVVQTTLSTMLWSDVVAGALVAILAGYNTYAERKSQRRETAST